MVSALTSTVSLKIIAALTGVAAIGFVLFHMAGNLQVFLGRDAYNDYAEFMQGLGALKWAARLGLLAIIGGHIGATLLLAQRNRKARPELYAGLKQRATSPAAMNMTLLGIVLLLFILYHLAHFTLGWVGTSFNGVDYFALEQIGEHGGRRDLYSHFIASFQQPLIVGFYIAANIALAAHLSHGATSMFQTLGLTTGKWRPVYAVVGPAIGVIVGLGNISMPLAVWAGIIGGN
jgi:succinate dehydrogenase / fumarate reductase cytochrome b subunit